MDEGVGHPLQHALDPEIEHAFERAFVEVEAAAMGGVDAGDRPLSPEPGRDHPAIGAALGAMAVQNVEADLGEMFQNVTHRDEIAQRNAATHRDAAGAERESGRDGGDDLVFELAAGQGVADDADIVTGSGLCVDQIDDVAEDAADRGANDVNDLQPIRHLHEKILQVCREARRDAGDVDIPRCNRT